MSPQDLEVRNYLQTLEQRVQKLEAEAAAQSAPVDETLQPTYLNSPQPGWSMPCSPAACKWTSRMPSATTQAQRSGG